LEKRPPHPKEKEKEKEKEKRFGFLVCSRLVLVHPQPQILSFGIAKNTFFYW